MSCTIKCILVPIPPSQITTFPARQIPSLFNYPCILQERTRLLLASVSCGLSNYSTVNHWSDCKMYVALTYLLLDMINTSVICQSQGSRQLLWASANDKRGFTLELMDSLPPLIQMGWEGAQDASMPYMSLHVIRPDWHSLVTIGRPILLLTSHFVQKCKKKQ